MHKNLIPILVFLASSTAYAQATSKKVELHPAHKLSDLPTASKVINSSASNAGSIQKMHDDFLKLKLPPLLSFPAKPNVFYNYTVNVEKVTKDKPSPITIYSSTGVGTEINTSYFYNYKNIPYVKHCIKEEGKEFNCSYDNLRTGFGYMINVSKPYDKVNHEVSIEISLTDLIKWRSFEGSKLELPETRMLHMEKRFAYNELREKTLEYIFKKKTVVFKSSEYDKNDSGEEYIFTVTIEPTYQKETK